MFGRRREGRGRATPILKNLDYLENYNKKTVKICAWFLLHQVGNDPN